MNDTIQTVSPSEPPAPEVHAVDEPELSDPQPSARGGPPDSASLVERASSLSVLVAVALALVKLMAMVATGSAALMSTAVDSFGDVAASGMIWLSFRASQRPVDSGHRLGHGRPEAVSALTQAAFVAGAGLFALSIAIRQFLYPEPLHHTSWGLAVMVVSIVATLGLVSYQRRVVTLTGSSAIAADRAHYESDLITHVAVVLSLVGAGLYGLERLDPLIGAGLAVYLLFMAFRIGRDAVHSLLERAMAPEMRAQIEARALAHPGVLGLHDLRTREVGDERFVELHVAFAPDTRMGAARLAADRLEIDLEELVPGAEVIVHPMPAGDDPET
ncbi:cation diffusion facilitator family transporter [Geminicoccus roseus]|uniref:cation diffusion facilitator family transporter n=1 Tax=Geminicoccus roseus TaxID=404900 RepID=UPI000407FC35|nr:cation diffusion facilitator family transporter [Geminicoccus roseus]